MLILGIALISIDTKFKDLPYKQQAFDYITTPIYYFTNSFQNVFVNSYVYFVERNNLNDTINLLKNQNLELKAQQLRYDKLLDENKRLRLLFNSSTYLNEKFLIAEVLDISIDSLGKRFIVNKGVKDGAFVGQAVLSADGVVGQVIAVQPHSSIIILITDAEHAIPVESRRTGLRTIAVGVGSENSLELLNVLKDSDIKIGDSFISSGLGDRFPDGYPIGVVTQVEYFNKKAILKVKIKPLVNFDTLKEILLTWNVKETLVPKARYVKK